MFIFFLISLFEANVEEEYCASGLKIAISCQMYVKQQVCEVRIESSFLQIMYACRHLMVLLLPLFQCAPAELLSYAWCATLKCCGTVYPCHVDLGLIALYNNNNGKSSPVY